MRILTKRISEYFTMQMLLLGVMFFLIHNVHADNSNDYKIFIKNDSTLIKKDIIADLARYSSFNSCDIYQINEKPFILKGGSENPSYYFPHIKTEDPKTIFFSLDKPEEYKGDITIEVLAQKDIKPHFKLINAINSNQHKEVSIDSFSIRNAKKYKMKIINKTNDTFYLVIYSEENFSCLKEDDINDDSQMKEIKPYIIPVNTNTNIKANLEIDSNGIYIKNFIWGSKQLVGFCKDYKYNNDIQYKYALTESRSCPKIEKIYFSINGINNVQEKVSSKKIQFEHQIEHEKPIPVNNNMFFFKDNDEKHTAKNYKFSDQEKNPVIDLTFDIKDRDLLSANNELSNKKIYGIKFAQSSKTITFEGKIAENEWLYRDFWPQNKCAFLTTIYIRQGTKIVSTFKGFQNENGSYLLSTEDRYKNEDVADRDSIYVCIDKQQNPGSLQIKQKIALKKKGQIHEFKVSDFEFLCDSKIQVDDIQQDYIPGKPSFLLKLKYEGNGLKYKKCAIVIKENKRWVIQSKSDNRQSQEGEWSNLGSNHWSTYLSLFSFDNSGKEIRGAIYNRHAEQFDLIVPPLDNQEKATRIDVYVESGSKPEKLEFFLKIDRNQLTSLPHYIPFQNDHFRFKNNPNKVVTRIKYNHKDSKYKPRPSILLTIEQKDCVIEQSDYSFYFKSAGNYRITARIENWKPYYSGEYLVATINQYKVFDQTDSTNNVKVSIKEPLFIYIKDQKDFNNIISFKLDIEADAGEKKQIQANNFVLQGSNYKGISFLPDFNTSQQSILLSIIKSTGYFTPKKLSSSLGILPFSDNMLTPDLMKKLDMSFIHSIEDYCKKIFLSESKQGVIVELIKYPTNINPFSIELIEIPPPTIEKDESADPESILKRINKQDRTFKTLIFGHIEEDLINNELILCIRGFISKLDDRLSVKRKIKIPNNKISVDKIKANIKEMVVDLINRLPENNIIENQYNSLLKTSISSQRPARQKTQESKPNEVLRTEDIWNRVDKNSFDKQEYKHRSQIYDKNINKGFYCSLQKYDYDVSKKNQLETSVWRNIFKRVAVIDKTDPFNNSFYIEVISEHKLNHHKHTFYIIKAIDNKLDLVHANRKVCHFNNIKFAGKNQWKIPTIDELTQIFQFKEYQESTSNIITKFIPKPDTNVKICFWTSTFQDKTSKILWQVSFSVKHHDNSRPYSSLDYKLEYYELASKEKAYLLPIALE